MVCLSDAPSELVALANAGTLIFLVLQEIMPTFPPGQRLSTQDVYRSRGTSNGCRQHALQRREEPCGSVSLGALRLLWAGAKGWTPNSSSTWAWLAAPTSNHVHVPPAAGRSARAGEAHPGPPCFPFQKHSLRQNIFVIYPCAQRSGGANLVLPPPQTFFPQILHHTQAN